MAKNNLVNEDYEKAVLACMILDNSLIDVIGGKIQAEYFSIVLNQMIYTEIIKEYKTSKCSTILTLSQNLPDLKAGYIVELTDVIPSTANYEFYVNALKQLYLARKLRADLQIKAESVTAENVIDTIHELDSDLTSYMQIESGKAVAIKDMTLSFIDELQTKRESTSPYLGIHTGWDNLSSIIDGVKDDKLYVVGARPNMGKSAFGEALLINLAVAKEKTAFLSFEMTKEEIQMRAVSQLSGVPIYNLEHKMYTSSSVQRINNALETLYNCIMDLIDEPVKDEKELFSIIRYLAKTKGTKRFLIDHLGLIRGSDKSAKRHEQVHNITFGLKNLAKELHISIFLLCQANRNAEGKKPSISDLRESGDIEQDADVVMLLNSERNMSNATEVDMEVLVVKHRGGMCGSAPLKFIPKLTKYIEVSQRDDQKTA